MLLPDDNDDTTPEEIFRYTISIIESPLVTPTLAILSKNDIEVELVALIGCPKSIDLQIRNDDPNRMICASHVSDVILTQVPSTIRLRHTIAQSLPYANIPKNYYYPSVPIRILLALPVRQFTNWRRNNYIRRNRNTAHLPKKRVVVHGNAIVDAVNASATKKFERL